MTDHPPRTGGNNRRGTGRSRRSAPAAAYLQPALSFDDEPGDLPAYTNHHGHHVEWAPWEQTPACSHLQPRCEACGYDGRPWVCAGKQYPGPGPAQPVTEGGAVEATQGRRDHPIWRLSAFRCVNCRQIRIYEHAGGFHLATEINDQLQ